MLKPQEEKQKILCQYCIDLMNPEKRESALHELSKVREEPDLAPILWHSVGAVAVLLQEVIAIYPLLSPPDLPPHASNRVCNALALFQCLASHKETRALFINAHIPLFLYPFLNTVSTTKPFEYLRLTSLGVIGALVKVDHPEVVNFLLSTEIIPLCLRIMESGSELSQTVATFIIQKILLDDVGLKYVCHTYDRFTAVNQVLSSLIARLEKKPSLRLLRHVVRCFLRLSENGKAAEALVRSLPNQLKQNYPANSNVVEMIKEDENLERWLMQIWINLSSNHSRY